MSTETCSFDADLAQRIAQILSYCGSLTDIVLNYVVLALNFSCCYWRVAWHDTEITRKEHRIQQHAVFSLVFVTVFQIVLCLVVGCAGISIIWCAMAGWIIAERSWFRGAALESCRRLLQIERVLVLIDVAVIIYYAIVDATIATLAHLCAIVLGALLSLTPSFVRSRSHQSMEGESGQASSLLDNTDSSATLEG